MTESPQIPQIRLVTVSYYSAEQVKGLLESLGTATRRRVSVVVVDNSEQPEAELSRICSDFGANLVSCPSNPGFGVASNRGAILPVAGRAAEPWLVFANPDLRFLPGTLDALVDVALKHPQAAVFGPALVDETGKRYPTGRTFPYFSVGIGHAVLGRIWPGNPFTRRYWGTAWRGKLTAKVDWVSGACQLWRREDWQALHGFDSSFFMYFEDMDLCLKARRKLGKTAMLVAGTEVVHLQGSTTGNVTSGTGGTGTGHLAFVGDKNSVDKVRGEEKPEPKTIKPETTKPERAKIVPNPKALRAHHESALIFLHHLYPQAGWKPILALIGIGLRLRYALLSRRR